MARDADESLSVIHCASTDEDMTLSPDFERAQRAKVERRLVALAELARRIREANEAEPVRLGAVAAVH